ncbi:MAG: transporter substrate-binding domain-containing protein [Bdellovibrionota bacterium]|nr:transporter substrate-binding domain-containing protein [Bdellovibrionota bacterium]
MKKFLILFSLLAFVSNTYALTDLKWWTEEYGPYNYRDKSTKKIEGISIELLEATHKELGVSLTRKNYKLAPWARGYKAAQKSGKMNVIFSTTRSLAREPIFKWFGPVAPATQSLFAIKGTAKPSSNSQIKGFKIAVIRDDIAQLTLESKDYGVPSSKLVKLAKIKPMFKNVAKGKTKYFAYNENVAKFSFKNLYGGEFAGKFEVVYKLAENDELWYAVNKSVDDATVQAYQDALDKVKAKASVRKVLKAKHDFVPATKAESLFASCGLTGSDQACKKK